jgi:L-glyceraldehyde 3-phosphate reductase
MTSISFSPERYSHMQYRRCGSSGLQLPLVSLGFWQSLGEAGNEELCRDVMIAAFNAGITHFDFANNYGPPPGNSEEVAGHILKEFPRDELIISSKAGYRMWDGPYGIGGSRKYLVASCDQSLKRLQLDYVDIFYHHCWTPDTALEESLEALDYIVRSGRALYVGVSSYNGEQFHQACEIIRKNNWTRITIHQPVMNMFTRVHEFGLLPETGREGVGVIPFCPLAQGILTDRYLNGLPEDSRQGRRGAEGRKWYDEHEQKGTWTKVRALNELAKERGQTLAQMALAWLLRDERVTSVLIGVSKLEQLQQNLDTLKNLQFSLAELEKIETILDNRPKR